MNGLGYLWKGMADRFGAFTDRKLADEEARKERDLKREQFGWDSLAGSLTGGLDRASRLKIAADAETGENNRAAANQRGMNYSAVANSHRQMAANYEKAISDLKYSGDSPATRSQVRNLEAKARAELLKADEIERTKMSIDHPVPEAKESIGQVIRKAVTGGK